MNIPPRVRAALLLLRALMLAGVAVLPGAALHESAGGRSPGAAVLLGLWAVATVGAVALLGRQPTPMRALTAVLGSQSLLHVALTAFTDHHTEASTTAAAHGAHLAHATTTLADSAHAPTASGSQLPMVAAHLIASAVVVWWMAEGERALWVLLRLSFRPVQTSSALCRTGWALADELTGTAHSQPPCSHHADAVITRVLSARAVTRRGPPVPGV